MSEKKHGTSSSGRPIASADQTKRNVLASAYKSDSEKRPKSTTVGRTRKMIENSRGADDDACDSDQVQKKSYDCTDIRIITDDYASLQFYFSLILSL